MTVLLPLLIVVGLQSVPSDGTYSLGIGQFGSEMTCFIETVEFAPGPGRLKTSDGRLLLDGKPVWLYSNDDLKPRRGVKSVTVRVDETEVKIPAGLLTGLYDVNHHACELGEEISGAIWIEPDRKHWHLDFSCGDGGPSFEVYIHGKVGDPTVYREDYRESQVVGRYAARVNEQEWSEIAARARGSVDEQSFQADLDVVVGLLSVSKEYNFSVGPSAENFKEVGNSIQSLPRIAPSSLNRVALTLDGWADAGIEPDRPIPPDLSKARLNVHTVFVLYVLLQLQVENPRLVLDRAYTDFQVPIAIVLRGTERVEDRENRMPWVVGEGGSTLCPFMCSYFRTPGLDANVHFLERVLKRFSAQMDGRPSGLSGLQGRS